MCVGVGFCLFRNVGWACEIDVLAARATPDNDEIESVLAHIRGSWAGLARTLQPHLPGSTEVRPGAVSQDKLYATDRNGKGLRATFRIGPATGRKSLGSAAGNIHHHPNPTASEDCGTVQSSEDSLAWVASTKRDEK